MIDVDERHIAIDFLGGRGRDKQHGGRLRRLRIGYGRAAAILDMMEQEGFVGPSDGSKPRVVKQEAYDYVERLDQIKEE